MALPTKYKDVCVNLECGVRAILSHYLPVDVLMMSERDAILAANIVLMVRALWMVDNTVKINTRTAKAMRTTKRKLENLFPGEWYASDPSPSPDCKDEDPMIVVIPESVYEDINNRLAEYNRIAESLA